MLFTQISFLKTNYLQVRQLMESNPHFESLILKANCFAWSIGKTNRVQTFSAEKNSPLFLRAVHRFCD
jgi:hypothetical protein